LHKGCRNGVSLKCPLTRKEYNKEQGAISNTLPPAAQIDVKKLFGKALKCKNKKQEARRKKKIEQKKSGREIS